MAVSATTPIELINTVYDVVMVPTGGQPLYEVDYNGDRYAPPTSNFLRRTRTRVMPSIRSQDAMEPGDTYHIERHAYHQAFVPEHIATCTLVRMHTRSPGAVMVVGLDGYPGTINFTRVAHRARAFAEQLSP